MLNAIKHCMGNLTNFAGRDPRTTFWFFVLFLFIAQVVIAQIAAIPIYVATVQGTFEAASQGGDPAATAPAIMAGLAGEFGTLALVNIAVGVIAALLLLAAFVRRLHDAGFSGWIAAIPLAAQAFNSAYAYNSLGRLEELTNAVLAESASGGSQMNAYAAQAQMDALGLVGYIGYAVIIGFGVLKSQDGDNRYGPNPHGVKPAAD
ncbi:MAG: DUF805 domain-containing protein [Pseudomonadota bacterium]